MATKNDYRISVRSGAVLTIVRGKLKGQTYVTPDVYHVDARWLPRAFAFEFNHPGDGLAVRVSADDVTPLEDKEIEQGQPAPTPEPVADYLTAWGAGSQIETHMGNIIEVLPAGNGGYNTNLRKIRYLGHPELSPEATYIRDTAQLSNSCKIGGKILKHVGNVPPVAETPEPMFRTADCPLCGTRNSIRIGAARAKSFCTHFHSTEGEYLIFWGTHGAFGRVMGTLTPEG